MYETTDVVFSSKLNITTSRVSCFHQTIGGGNQTVAINLNARDGGIPVTLGLNCLGWLLLFALFCVIRRLVWDYGQLAVVQREDEGWASVFYGRHDSNGGNGVRAKESKSTVEFPEVKTKGIFSWIPVLFRVTDEHIHLKCGVDAWQYISFQKHLMVFAVVIFCLSIGIVLPVNYSGNNETDPQSFGGTTVSNLRPNSSAFWLHTVFAILYLAIMVVITYHFTSLFNFESHDFSSKTVMITNIPKTVAKELVQHHFEEIYGGSEVLEVQLAYNFDQLMAMNRKLEAASLGREHCEDVLQATGERPQTVVSTSKVSPCCPCCGAMHVDGIEYFTEEEEELKSECEQARRELKSLGIAFVTFSNARIVERCLQDFNLVKHGSPESSVSRKIFSDHWNVSQAPIPGNIMWDHLTVDPESWWARALIINILLLIFVMFVTTPSVLLTSFQEIEAAIRKTNPNLQTPASAFWNQFVPTLLLWMFAALLPTVVTYTSYFEAHWTRSKLEHSVMVKTFVFLMLMVLILPSLALTSAEALFQLTFTGGIPRFASRFACVFLPNNGAFFVNYLITSALIGTAAELCRFPELIAYAARMAIARTEGEKRLVRKEAVREFAFGQQYAWMLCIFALMVVYSLTCPLVVPFGLLYLLLKHIVDRYNLYFNYRAPAYKYMDSSVHSTAVTFAVVSTFLLIISILFYSIIRLGVDDAQTIFTLVIVAIIIVLYVGKVCFGMFKKYGPQKQRLNIDEESITDLYSPEAFLPPVLRSAREMNVLSGNDSSPPQLTRRKQYGTTSTSPTDHVIDASNLTPSTQTVVTVADDDVRQ